MPQVLHIDGFEVFIYSNDHRPMHAHVWHAEMEVEICLVDLSIKDMNREATQKFVKESIEIVRAHRSKLMREWKKTWKKRESP